MARSLSWRGRRAAPGAARPWRWERPARPCTARGAPRASSAPSTTARRRSRRPPRWSPPRAVRASRSPVDHLEPDQVEALVQRIDAERGRLDVLVNDIWGGERLFEWDTPVWEHDLDKGLRMLRLAIDTHLITSHFALPLLIRTARRAGRRDDRRHSRIQRRALPELDLLRPGQERRHPARVRPGRGARAARLHRGRADPGLDALGDDARATTASPRRTGATARPSIRTSPRSPRARGSSAARSPRSPPTRTSHGATAARSPPAGWRASTGSRTSTAPSPTAGATWSRCRTPGLPADPAGYR